MEAYCGSAWPCSTVWMAWSAQTSAFQKLLRLPLFSSPVTFSPGRRSACKPRARELQHPGTATDPHAGTGSPCQHRGAIRTTEHQCALLRHLQPMAGGCGASPPPAAAGAGIQAPARGVAQFQVKHVVTRSRTRAWTVTAGQSGSCRDGESYGNCMATSGQQVAGVSALCGGRNTQAATSKCSKTTLV